MAIVAIGAIVDPDYRYGCLKKCLDLRIAASETDFVLTMNLEIKIWKFMRKYFSFMKFEYPLYILARNDALEHRIYRLMDKKIKVNKHKLN